MKMTLKLFSIYLETYDEYNSHYIILTAESEEKAIEKYNNQIKNNKFINKRYFIEGEDSISEIILDENLFLEYYS